MKLTSSDIDSIALIVEAIELVLKVIDSSWLLPRLSSIKEIIRLLVESYISLYPILNAGLVEQSKPGRRMSEVVTKYR